MSLSKDDALNAARSAIAFADTLIDAVLDATEMVYAQRPERPAKEVRVATIAKFLMTSLAEYDNDPELIFAVAGRALDRMTEAKLGATQ